MSNEQNDGVKRCFFCHKRLIGNHGLICKRCKLLGRDIGEKVIGVGATVGTVTVAVLKAVGEMNTDNSDDN